MSRIAGAVEAKTIMAELASARPVFHSEAGFQHAFAWVLHGLDPSLEVRLEVRQQGREYLDLLCFGAHGRAGIEFKYFTAKWEGTDPATGEQFRLRGHEACDLARRNFVFDIARLERFCASSGQALTGLAILLTNDRRLWDPPLGPVLTRDTEFRLHEGRTLTGALRWGTEGAWFPANERALSGSYPLAWSDYTRLDGRNGEFRWLAALVTLDSGDELPAKLTTPPTSRR